MQSGCSKPPARQCLRQQRARLQQTLQSTLTRDLQLELRARLASSRRVTPQGMQLRHKPQMLSPSSALVKMVC